MGIYGGGILIAFCGKWDELQNVKVNNHRDLGIAMSFLVFLILLFIQ